MPFRQEIRQHIISYFDKLRNKTKKKHIEHEKVKKQIEICNFAVFTIYIDDIDLDGVDM